MARANSNNHGNEGQEVLYCDGHVDWAPTPFVGAQRTGYQYRDHIYTRINGTASTDGSSTVLDASAPQDAFDAYLLPTSTTAANGI
jgi:hypothetical protein